MKNKEKREGIAKNQGERLKSKLKIAGINLRKFADNFYHEEVDSEASSSELDEHFERLKTSVKRNSEVSSLYLYYYESKEEEPPRNSKSDRNAAWELYVEISSRVSTCVLEDNLGEDTSALDSLYSLFGSWREISKKYGFQAINMTKDSKFYFDEVLRPFTTKWHGKLKEAEINIEFREDLASVQKKTAAFSDNLESYFRSL